MRRPICIIVLSMVCVFGLVGSAMAVVEWSDIQYLEGMYSRVYFDYVDGTFYCINDWIVNQDDGGVEGGMRLDEYNAFTFGLEGDSYEVRIYGDNTGQVYYNGLPGALPGFDWRYCFATSPNEPSVQHTIWEWSFDVTAMTRLTNFKPKDPVGPRVVFNPAPPPFSTFSTGPSAFEHFVDGCFADEWTPCGGLVIPTRDYQEPEPDPGLLGVDILCREEGGVSVTPEPASALLLLLGAPVAYWARHRRKADS